MLNDGYQHSAEKDRLRHEALTLRQLFGDATEEAWRRERLFRYLYLRRHGHLPARNFIGSWIVEDLQAEIAMWRTYATRNLDNDDILEELTAFLGRQFEMTWTDAVSEGTSPLLAQVGAPVWHAATSSLVPPTIGSMHIYEAFQHPESGDGWSYNYGSREIGNYFTLILYDRGEAAVADGVADERIGAEFHSAMHDVKTVRESNGATLLMETMIGPVNAEHSDHLGRTALFVGFYVEYQTANGERYGTALQLCGFRRHFLKLRYTAPAPLWYSDTHDIAAIHSHIAEYVAMYR